METGHAVVEMEMAQARREGNRQYGEHANAEELIRAHIASIDPVVRRLSLRQLNEEATATLDLSKIEVPTGGTLVSAVVRGDDPKTMGISYVWEDAGKRYHKGAEPYDAATYSVDPETAVEQAAREHALSKPATPPAGDTPLTDAGKAAYEQKIADLQQQLDDAQAQSVPVESTVDAAKAADEADGAVADDDEAQVADGDTEADADGKAPEAAVVAAEPGDYPKDAKSLKALADGANLTFPKGTTTASAKIKFLMDNNVGAGS